MGKLYIATGSCCRYFLTKYLKEQKVQIKLLLQAAAEDQRVDLTLAHIDKLSDDPFLNTLNNKILLPL
jgi:hypothetical protein